MPDDVPTILIIGAGPAGLTAASDIVERGMSARIIIVEATGRIGGISCTINHNGNRIDIGGHRFFSKDDRVMAWWARKMPAQGRPARDDFALGRNPAPGTTGPDPETEDRVMLVRSRVSRIWYLRRFFDYPLSLSGKTLANLGLRRLLRIGFGYAVSRVWRRKPEVTLEDFMVNRFGRALYAMFFERYSEKVWGVHPREIPASWGTQRIKGLSLTKAVIAAVVPSRFRRSDGSVAQKGRETSLIERFLYPKYGPGHLWETVADDLRRQGVDIRLRQRVDAIEIADGRVRTVTVREQGGGTVRIPCDHCLSSMPIPDLIAGMGTVVPSDVQAVAQGLAFRDFITIGILVDRLLIANDTEHPTLGGLIPDNWIYIQEPDIRMARLQIFNNWSPYMVADGGKSVWIGLEYICSTRDDLWRRSDADLIRLGVEELATIGLIDPAAVRDSCCHRIEKAYPAYFGTYDRLETVKTFLNGIGNLYCIGRNGQHRYNNQDHSMLTAFAAVDCIAGTAGERGRERLWSVNAEGDYHEHKSSGN